jgi:hypothetical protein
VPFAPLAQAVIALFGLFAVLLSSSSSLHAETPEPAFGKLPSSEALRELLDVLNAPPSFTRHLQRQRSIDAFSELKHNVESNSLTGVTKVVSKFKVGEEVVRSVTPLLPEEVQKFRQQQSQAMEPLPGFRAPVLGNTNNLEATAAIAAQSINPGEVAQLIQRQLPREGLMATLAAVLRQMGPERFTSGEARSAAELEKHGFPVDLLRYVRLGQGRPNTAGAVIVAVAKALEESEDFNRLSSTLKKAPFVYTATDPNFSVALESGEEQIATLRLQLSGGFRNGVVKGGTVDVIGQLVAAVPHADLLVTVPEQFAEDARLLAMRCWPLGRPARLTLVSHPGPILAWAQDNAKPGIVVGADKPRAALLVPRFASRGEASSTYTPSESYLVDGLRQAGVHCVQSALLFQGGDLLIAREGKKRVLFTSEATLYRNIALGLNHDQVLQAFRAEFKVDEVVVLPAVSFHIDYDVSFRTLGEEKLAFMNDDLAAALQILQRITLLLSEQQLLPATALDKLRDDLQKQNWADVLKLFNEFVDQHRAPSGEVRDNLVRRFNAGYTDSPSHNFEIFLGALHVLRSRTPMEKQTSATTEENELIRALSELHSRHLEQEKLLASRGWKVVKIPSLHSYYRSANYVNGVQDKAAIYVPVIGGFYSSLDDAAVKAYEAALPSNVKVVRINTRDIQRVSGALHCVVSAIPASVQ